MTGLERWLEKLQDAPLECDGMTRVISTLLQASNIDHCIEIGSLEVQGAGVIPLHWWIRLPDDRIVDLRARMWLGDGVHVPNGVFEPGQGVNYAARSIVEAASVKLSPALFWLLSGQRMDSFELLAPDALLDRAADRHWVADLRPRP